MRQLEQPSQEIMVTNQSGSGGGRNPWKDTEYNLRIKPTCFDDTLAEWRREHWGFIWSENWVNGNVTF